MASPELLVSRAGDTVRSHPMAGTAPRGGDPVGVAFGLGDMVAALHAVVGTLAALRERDRTGQGREIDLSQLEAVASHTGTSLLEAALGAPSRSYDGNRHPGMAPHGAFPCIDEGDLGDRWVAIACWTDDEWSRLAQVIGVDDPSLADAVSRHRRVETHTSARATGTRARYRAASRRTRRQSPTRVPSSTNTVPS